jgi:hypothetical protein
VAIPPPGPYLSAPVHYTGTNTLTDNPPCTAALITSVTSPETVTLTLFYQQGVPAPGVAATYDPATREAGSWHWPADCR